jgi:hypothetical protein
MLVDVQVLPGVVAGQQVMVTAPNGQQVTVIVPRGLQPGATFKVQVPDASSQTIEPPTVTLKPHQGTCSTRFVLIGVSALLTGALLALTANQLAAPWFRVQHRNIPGSNITDQSIYYGWDHATLSSGIEGIKDETIPYIQCKAEVAGAILGSAVNCNSLVIAGKAAHYMSVMGAIVSSLALVAFLFHALSTASEEATEDSVPWIISQFCLNSCSHLPIYLLLLVVLCEFLAFILWAALSGIRLLDHCQTRGNRALCSYGTAWHESSWGVFLSASTAIVVLLQVRKTKLQKISGYLVTQNQQPQLDAALLNEQELAIDVDDVPVTGKTGTQATMAPVTLERRAYVSDCGFAAAVVMALSVLLAAAFVIRVGVWNSTKTIDVDAMLDMQQERYGCPAGAGFVHNILDSDIIRRSGGVDTQVAVSSDDQCVFGGFGCCEEAAAETKFDYRTVFANARSSCDDMLRTMNCAVCTPAARSFLGNR